ncbi:MAG: ABC transporter substrate-binding protein [Treponema sp.]|jgi:iron complex transport system substrate-binding protein|nr:ABC transporter substrate-binding protein [Treponema sp.]
MKKNPTALSGEWAAKTILVLALMLLPALACFGKGKTQPASTEPAAATPAGGADSVEYPIVIRHAFGETVIKSKPQRVATIQWANQDVALALGVVPVGFSAANYGVLDDSGILPWTAKKLEELGVKNPNVFRDTDGLDFEAIADCRPDIILAAYSGITKEDYDLLTQIAPVVAYPSKPWVTTWREQILYNARGMGLEAEGRRYIAELEALIAAKVAEHPEIKGAKITWVNFSATDMSQFHIYTLVDPRGSFLTGELGMEYPASVLNAISDPTVYSMRFSAESADVLNDLDVIIGYGGEELYKAIKADLVYGSIPAIQKGAVVFIDDLTLSAAGTPGPLSIPYTIDAYISLIAAAVQKSNGQN